MRKTVSALFFLLLFLFLTIAGVFVNLVGANPVWVGYYPTEPVKTPPTITFQSPVKYQIYEPNSAWLNFSIVKPESWFLQVNDGYDEQGNPAVFTLVNITSISYMIDGATNISIPVHDLTRYRESFPSRSLNFSTNLSLPEGTHNLAVSVNGESCYYSPGQYVTNGPSRIQVNFTSEIINFAVGTQEPFPTALVSVASGASAIVVAAGLVVYLRRRKR